eukprot:TRINITY_DN25228_c1_g2_i2.p2 TRINITY_DN25228_c1_g2~~TRINITY_DN25228_c1_g2_i2.p2  ORF type:complete len:144 (+),score=24.36 TRINITY_DN25228_c1_g2_i2:187-618(+)
MGKSRGKLKGSIRLRGRPGLDYQEWTWEVSDAAKVAMAAASRAELAAAEAARYNNFARTSRDNAQDALSKMWTELRHGANPARIAVPDEPDVPVSRGGALRQSSVATLLAAALMWSAVASEATRLGHPQQLRGRSTAELVSFL